MKIESKQGMDRDQLQDHYQTSSDAIRIDYFKMMRKWRTDLYRYGLRMTYDMTIPTPGVRPVGAGRRWPRSTPSSSRPFRSGGRRIISTRVG